MGRRVFWAEGACAGVAATLVACASAPEPRVADPAVTTRAVGKALSEGNADAAYAWLHPELREKTSSAAFRERVKLAGDEARELGSELAEAHEPPVARAEVTLDSGERVSLVLSEGQWRIAGGVLDSVQLDTPLAAVAELRHALLRRSLPALLRLLARERRTELEALVEATLEQSADVHDLVVEVSGERAVVRLSGGGEIHLRREAGKWRLWDVR